MKKIVACLGVLLLAVSGFSATHVFWYKATTNGYNLTASNPGPGLPSDAVVHERIIASGGVAQHSGAASTALVFGSGLDDAQGRCAFFWSLDLDSAKGTATSAKIRAEYRDGWSNNAFCNSGTINIRAGVADFDGNIQTWGGAEYVPETADWQDFLNPISSSMHYDYQSTTLQAEEIIAYTAEAGRPDEFSPSVLDGKFFEVDVTDQVNWILSNTMENKGALSGHYAIMLLVPVGEGNTGKVNTYSEENCPDVSTVMGSDNPWTADANTCHLVIGSDNLQINVENAPVANIKSGVSLHSLPNPFTSATTLNYNTDKALSGMLEVYNAAGQVVFGKTVSGQGSVFWNAGDLAIGIYMARLTAGSKVISIKMMLIR
jgi:hypothetical protein